MTNMQTQVKKEGHFCEDCNKAFTTKENFEGHLCFITRMCSSLCDFTKRLPKGVHCCLCGKILRWSQNLKNHMHSHSGEKPHVCPHCQFRTSSSSHLNVHIVRNHTKEFKHNCFFCSKGFVSKAELQNHILKSHPTDETKGEAEKKNKKRPDQTHCCPHCTFVTKTKRSLTLHLWTHTSYRPFQCEFCNKGYTKKNQFMDHLRTHTGERPFVCNICDQGFCSTSSLRTHEINIHSEMPLKKRQRKKKIPTKKFVLLVPANGKGSGLVCNITQLQHSEHSKVGDKRHSCPLCPFSASSELCIKTHLKTHSDELGCSKVSDRVVFSKEGHLATCEGKQTVQCEFCRKAFSQKEITEHQSACGDEYPYTCNFCSERFRSQSVWEIHESQLHSRSRVQVLPYKKKLDLLSCKYQKSPKTCTAIT